MWDGCLHTVTTTHVTAAHWSGLQINILLYNRSGGVRQNHSLSLSPAEEDEESAESGGKEVEVEGPAAGAEEDPEAGKEEGEEEELAEEAEEESAESEEKEAPEWFNEGECHSTRYGYALRCCGVRSQR